MFKEFNFLKPFLEEPTREYNVREFAKLVKMSPATASKNLKEFSKKSFLVYRKERNLDLYKANLEGSSYRDVKIYYNIQKIRNSMILDELNQFYLKPTVVLFGSASTGLDTLDSDFDILVISEKNEKIDLEKYEKKLNRGIQLFVYKSIKQIKNNHLVNSILGGIILQGEIKWI